MGFEEAISTTNLLDKKYKSSTDRGESNTAEPISNPLTGMWANHKVRLQMDGGLSNGNCDIIAEALAFLTYSPVFTELEW